MLFMKYITLYTIIFIYLICINSQNINANMNSTIGAITELKYIHEIHYVEKETPSQHTSNWTSPDIDCPKSEDIAPCECMWDVNWGPSIYCLDVSSQEEFDRAFDAHFPAKTLDILELQGSENVTSFENDVFNDLQFEYIYLFNCNVTYIGPEAFIKSIDTIWYWDILRTPIGNEGFPFETLSQYTALEWLTLNENNYTEVPKVHSPYLKKLELRSNNFGSVKQEDFTELPNLTFLSLSGNNLENIDSGTFSDLPSLEYLDLGWNKLKTLPADLVHMKTRGILNVPYNLISTIEPNSMTGIKTLELSHNRVRNLHEESWRSIFEQVDNRDLLLLGNPIRCRCNMLWLAQNETLKKKLDYVQCNLIISPPYVSEVKPEDLGDCNHTITFNPNEGITNPIELYKFN